MKTQGIADWYLIKYSPWDIKKYQELGGDMSRAIIHFLTYDDDTLNPLWFNFKKIAERMKSLEVQNVVAPDFSLWLDLPTVARLYNLYKSAVVTRDLWRAGFRVLPHPCFSYPEFHHLEVGWWGKLNVALIDGNHIHGRMDKRWHLWFWQGIKKFVQSTSVRKIWFWASAADEASKWKWLVGSQKCIYCPSRIRMVGTQAGKRAREAKGGVR